MGEDQMPSTLRLEYQPLTIRAEAEVGDGSPKMPRFELVAYSGSSMRMPLSRLPVVVDMAGVEMPAAIPVLYGHNADDIVGHTESVGAESGRIVARGVISGGGPTVDRIVALSKNGFPWQASIGADIDSMERVEEGVEAQVNGSSIKGPALIVRRSTLREISVVAMGADRNTSTSIAAKSDAKARSAVMDEETRNQGQGNAERGSEAASMDAIFAKAKAESDRVAGIRDIVAGILAKRPSAHAHLQALTEQAIEAGWTVDKFRASARDVTDRLPPVITSKADAVASEQVLAAATYLAAKMDGAERAFDPQTLEVAAKHFKNFSLHELLLRCARANGWHGTTVRSDIRGVLQAAFNPTNASLPGIFSNIANKFLLESFNGVESTWREISTIRSVPDFKPVTSYRLTGDAEYERVAPSGELKSGTLGEESFTNRAATYGKVFGLTREDVINDDLGALTALIRRIGRGAALSLNKVFWTEFLANISTFFTAARKNTAVGATSALGIDSLTAAETLFLNQTDNEGNPLAIMPSILLVPNALFVLANQLMGSTTVFEEGNSAARKFPTMNPHNGKFRVLRSSYLSNANITGNSATAWYLLANPTDLPVIEVAFLNGSEQPVVESAEADFDRLGIQMRGYHDFGVAKQDYRAAVRMALS